MHKPTLDLIEKQLKTIHEETYCQDKCMCCGKKFDADNRRHRVILNSSLITKELNSITEINHDYCDACVSRIITAIQLLKSCLIS